MAIADPLDLLTVIEVTIREGRLGVPWSPDVTEAEEHNSTVKPTRLPIENGSSITDHVVTDPDRLVLSIVVSNDDPTYLLAPTLPGVGGIIPRDVDAYQRLKGWQSNNTLLSIDTSLRTYENMLLTELSAPRSSDNGDALIASATFETIVTVETRRQSYKVTKKSTGDQSVKPKAKLAPAPVTDNGSILHALGSAVSAGH